MKRILLLAAVWLLVQSCQQANADFSISRGKVGKLTDTTKIYQIKYLYRSDSISKNIQNSSAFGAYEEYTIYDRKKGIPLLVVIPKQLNDSTSLIKTIELKNNIFKTDKGIGLASDFEEIQSKIKINKVEETIKYVVLYLDEINATIDINKDVLPMDVQHNRSIKIDETLIPDNAKISHFIVFMNE